MSLLLPKLWKLSSTGYFKCMYKINPFKEQDGSDFNEEMADGQTDIITTSRDSVGA